MAVIAGDEAKKKELLAENPWLQEYLDDGDETDVNLKQACAALGIMEDELNGAVPVDEVLFCLRQDFNTTLSRSQIDGILLDLEKKGYIKSELQGYVLTGEGGRICDAFLNSKNLQLDFLDED